MSGRVCTRVISLDASREMLLVRGSGSCASASRRLRDPRARLVCYGGRSFHAAILTACSLQAASSVPRLGRLKFDSGGLRTVTADALADKHLPRLPAMATEVLSLLAAALACRVLRNHRATQRMRRANQGIQPFYGACAGSLRGGSILMTHGLARPGFDLRESTLFIKYLARSRSGTRHVHSAIASATASATASASARGPCPLAPKRQSLARVPLRRRARGARACKRACAASSRRACPLRLRL